MIYNTSAMDALVDELQEEGKRSQASVTIALIKVARAMVSAVGAKMRLARLARALLLIHKATVESDSNSKTPATASADLNSTSSPTLATSSDSNPHSNPPPPADSASHSSSLTSLSSLPSSTNPSSPPYTPSPPLVRLKLLDKEVELLESAGFCFEGDLDLELLVRVFDGTTDPKLASEF